MGKKEKRKGEEGKEKKGGKGGKKEKRGGKGRKEDGGMFGTLTYRDENGTMEVDGIKSYPHLKGSYVKLFVESKKQPYAFDRFMDKLYDAGVAKITVVEELIDSDWTKEEIVDLAQDTVTLINNEIDGIEEVKDKERMKRLVKDLYMESLSL